MRNHDFNHAILDQVGHRPWPAPRGPWLMTQTWHDLLFAHWSVDAASLRSKVPHALDVDVRDGRAWVGIVPFQMTNVAPRGVPALPGLSAFPELNVRTYVTAGGRPGVYFFSLDAGSAIAVTAARVLLNLPYYRASMRVDATDHDVRFRSRRTGDAGAQLDVRYAPAGGQFEAAPGSLEHFLTERYCLYHVDRTGTPYRLEIHHPPWPLQPAWARFARNTMAEAEGLTVCPKTPSLLHFARRQDMVAWAPSRIDEPPPRSTDAPA